MLLLKLRYYPLWWTNHVIRLHPVMFPFFAALVLFHESYLYIATLTHIYSVSLDEAFFYFLPLTVSLFLLPSFFLLPRHLSLCYFPLPNS